MVRFTGENYRGRSGRISFGLLFPGRCLGLRYDGPLGLLWDLAAGFYFVICHPGLFRHSSFALLVTQESAG